METLNYAKGVTLNFNLRKPLSKRPTNLYAVVKLSGKQIKIPTTAKICAYLWNSKKQLPVLSENMSDADKSNAMAVSSIIFSFQRAFADFYLYLYSRNEVVTADEVKNYLTEKVFSELKISRDMANNGVPNVKRTKSATKALRDAFKLYPQVNKRPIAESTLTTYKYNLQVFLNYCKDTKHDAISMLSVDGLNKYQVYLEKQGQSTDNIKNCLRIVVMLINKVIAKRPEFSNYGVKSVAFDLPTPIKSKGKKVELTDEELDAIRNCDGLTPPQKEYRDVFLLECYTGQRASDIHNFFSPELHTDKDEFIGFVTQKEKVPALVVKTPEVMEILERYKDGFKHIDINSEILAKNETISLKIIGKKAKLSRIIEYIDTKGNVQRKPLSELISSHFGRHTFVTRMARKISLEDLKLLTGHKDTQSLNKNYLHQTEDDRRNILKKALKLADDSDSHVEVAKMDVLNEVFSYDSLLQIENMLRSNIDVFHLDSTKQAINVIKDVAKISSYPKEIDKDKVISLDKVVFELSYYFRDVNLYSIFQFKEKYFGIIDNLASEDEIRASFALEDIERPKRENDAKLEEYENSLK